MARPVAVHVTVTVQDATQSRDYKASTPKDLKTQLATDFGTEVCGNTSAARNGGGQTLTSSSQGISLRLNGEPLDGEDDRYPLQEGTLHAEVLHSHDSLQQLAADVRSTKQSMDMALAMFQQELRASQAERQQLAQELKESKVQRTELQSTLLEEREGREADYARLIIREFCQFVSERFAHRAVIALKLEKDKEVKYVRVGSGHAVVGDRQGLREEKLPHETIKHIRNFVHSANFQAKTLDTFCAATVKNRNAWAHTVPSRYDSFEEYTRIVQVAAKFADENDITIQNAQKILVLAMSLYTTWKQVAPARPSDMLGPRFFRK